MKKIIALVLAVCSNLVFAGTPVNLNFANEPLPLNEFINLTYSNILKRDFIFTDSFVNDAQKIKININQINPNNFPHLIETLKREYGFNVRKEGSVDVLFFPKPVATSEPITQSLGLPVAATNKITDNSSKLEETEPEKEVKKSPVSPSLYRCRSNCAKLVEIIKPLYKDAVFTTHEDKLVIAASDADKIFSFLSSLDESPKNFTLRAFLYEFGNSKNSTSAIQVLTTLLDGSSGVEGKLNSAQNVLSNFLKISFPRFSILLTALGSDSRFNLISNPSGSVSLAESFSMNIGQQVPTLGTVVTSANGATQQSVNYRDSGITFTFTPKAVALDSILVAVNSELSAFSGVTPGLVTAPVLSRRSFTTTTNIKAGEVLAIAGFKDLKADQTNTTLFGATLGRSKQNSDSEFLVFLMLDPT